MELRAQAALLDIEGTVGSIAYVHTVLFPYARERMDAYVYKNIANAEVRGILDDAAREASLDPSDTASILRALHDWAARDVKVTPLKQLQGLIWAEGFEASGLRGHLYDDAIAAFRRFHDAGIVLAIYSSGSVAAQQLLFGYSIAGDLRPLFSNFYDTTIGGKRTRSSYDRIVAEMGIPAGRMVFFSDNTDELDAALEAGLQTVHVARPEDGVRPGTKHGAITSFAGVSLIP